MEWLRRFRSAFAVFIATLLANQQVTPAVMRLDDDESEQLHTHQEAIEPEDIVWEDEDKDGSATSSGSRPALLVTSTVATFRQCVPHNAFLLGGHVKAAPLVPDFRVTLREARRSVFKTGLAHVPGDAENANRRSFSKIFGGEDIGGWEFGSRIKLTFHVTRGVSLFVPVNVPLLGSLPDMPSATSSGNMTGHLALVHSDGLRSAQVPSSLATLSGEIAPLTLGSSGWEGSRIGHATYDVVQCDPNSLQSASIGVYVAFMPDTRETWPHLGASTVIASLSPSYTPLDMVPRFDHGARHRTAFFVVPCSTTLLFSFVTNQAGFDTGVAITNTSLDPFGTPVEAGTVTLFYYGGTTGGGEAPSSQRSTSIPPGGQLVFTLSNGGSHGIVATPGFQGYIVAIANFRHCHGLAFVQPLSADRGGPGYSYRAIEIERGSTSYAHRQMEKAFTHLDG